MCKKNTRLLAKRKSPFDRVMTENNKLDLKIDVPASWAEGQTLSWPINTGLKSRAFVFVRVTPPGDDQNEFTPCDVTHLGKGSCNFLRFGISFYVLCLSHRSLPMSASFTYK